MRQLRSACADDSRADTMTARFRRTAILLITLATVLAACSSSSSSDVPRRSDCIVKIALQWPVDISPREQEKTIDQMSSAMLFARAKGGPNLNPGQAFPNHRRDLLFLQFERECESRVRNAQELMEYVRTRVPTAPLFSVSHEVIQPGVDTIDLWGPPWRDSGESQLKTKPGSE